MNPKCLTVCGTLALVVATVACDGSKSATTLSPSAPTASPLASASTQVVASSIDVKTGITVTAPQLSSPADAQQFKFAEQPLTLTIKNAASTGTTALTYSFQVASDAGFATIVYSKDGVAEGANGQTSLKIDPLAG